MIRFIEQDKLLELSGRSIHQKIAPAPIIARCDRSTRDYKFAEGCCGEGLIECAIAIFTGRTHRCDPATAVCACIVAALVSYAVRSEACKGKDYGSGSACKSSRALVIR
jgi:hypothetical protein